MSKTAGPSLSMRAYERLHAEILAGERGAGDKININEAVNRMGFSLGAVREALSRLTSDGLVVAEANKGYRVASITQAELEDLTATRVMIECACLENAIRNGDLKWESGIVSSLFELTRTDLFEADSQSTLNPAWNKVHAEFHAALVAGCDSPWLLKIRDMLYVQAERYRIASAPLDRAARDLDAEHKAIADATLARDLDTAVAAMTDHLERTKRVVIDGRLGSSGKVA